MSTRPATTAAEGLLDLVLFTIAAASAGRSLTLEACDWTSAHMDELSLAAISLVEPDAYRIVGANSRIDNLPEWAELTRVVVCRSPRKLKELTYLIAADACHLPSKVRPAVIGLGGGSDDLPHAIRIHGTIVRADERVESVIRSLPKHPRPIHPDVPGAIQFDASLHESLNSFEQSAVNSFTRRTRFIAESLAVGAAAYRERDSLPPRGELRVGTEDYLKARAALVQSTAVGAGSNVDPLLPAIIGRASLYAKLHPSEALTMDLLTELGRQDSKQTCKLLHHILSNPDLNEAARLFESIGGRLRRGIGLQDCPDLPALALNLDQWTLRKLRDRLERLVDEGRATRTRQPGSRALAYKFDNAVGVTSEIFDRLPRL